MALVFKIKLQDTLRRWVVSESADSNMFSITLSQLESKVRELFQLPPTVSLAITYVDKENDLITLGDDGDLVDACLVQRLNPLRLIVQVLESKPEVTDRTAPTETPVQNFNIEAFLKSLFPHITTDAMQGFLRSYAQFLDPALPIGTLISKAQDAFKEFMESAVTPEHHKPSSSDKATHHHHRHGRHPYKHPLFGMGSKSMPCGPEHGSPMDGPIHVGVQCDGCGTTPIQGPRYKSSKIPDYDLCASCFQEKGNESDYQKLEQSIPSVYCHDHYCRAPYLRRGSRPFMRTPFSGRGGFSRGPYGWRPECGFGGHPWNSCPPSEEQKLDARFVKDVTIFDGTELAPGTKFTKIWCLSNIGTLPWPQSTQLMHIGGDVLSSQEAVNLELPENGLPCGEDVEVSVDLTAPDKAGRYISHWRLISPSGQKFGQRVWVMIQVVPQGEQSPLMQESLKGGKISENVNGDVDLTDQVMENKSLTDPTPELTATIVPSSDDGVLVHEVEVAEDFSEMNEEMEGFSLVEKPSASEVREEEMIVDSVDMKASQESNILSLESMGFTNGELNTFLLNKNNGNMQRTLDDLLVAAGWNGSLRDLQEMGFTDQATNIQLLLKYKGSIKAVVKDLLKLEKQKTEG